MRIIEENPCLYCGFMIYWGLKLEEVLIMPEECLNCGFYDSDRGCTCPPIDKWYACPLEPEPTAEDFMTEEELKPYRGGNR